jgi:uroporphyrin-III C-methyltransferase
MKKGAGKVTIAGAGPGQLEHLTLAALRAIHEADVILYDALIDDSILAEFPPAAESVFVGKRCGNHAYTQTMIIAAMITHAMQGKHVVRLKGGDPAIFAHLTSELEALRALQIEVKILPGVTAMLTAAACLKTPLTARKTNRHIWVTDGHAPDLASHAPAMAFFPGTLVFYMGAGRAAEIAELLCKAGMCVDMPAALVENAGHSEAISSVAAIADFRDGKFGRLTEGPGIFMVGSAISGETESHDIGAAKDAATAQL